MKFETHSPADLPKVVKELKKLFKERTILLLEGPVGAGKTELVKALCQEMGLPQTASPSFAIHHHYDSADGEQSMDHIDLYRLENEDDLESTGFWDLFGASEGLIVIEWSDRLNQDLLPLNWKKIKVEIKKESTSNHRTLVIT